jgi:hypothetical protein
MTHFREDFTPGPAHEQTMSIATNRAPLRAQSEHLYELPPLASPPASPHEANRME